MAIRILCCLFWAWNAFGYSIPEAVRQGYAQKMQEGFFLQSLGKTRNAFYVNASLT